MIIFVFKVINGNAARRRTIPQGDRPTAHCDAEILTFIEILFIYLRDLR